MPLNTKLLRSGAVWHRLTKLSKILEGKVSSESTGVSLTKAPVTATRAQKHSFIVASALTLPKLNLGGISSTMTTSCYGLGSCLDPPRFYLIKSLKVSSLLVLFWDLVLIEDLGSIIFMLAVETINKVIYVEIHRF
jgi:hypothetical protein